MRAGGCAVEVVGGGDAVGGRRSVGAWQGGVIDCGQQLEHALCLGEGGTGGDERHCSEPGVKGRQGWGVNGMGSIRCFRVVRESVGQLVTNTCVDIVGLLRLWFMAICLACKSMLAHEYPRACMSGDMPRPQKGLTFN